LLGSIDEAIASLFGFRVKRLDQMARMFNLHRILFQNGTDWIAN
jgi:hypothetical protein